MDINKIELDGETLYLKKGFFGWNIVNPIKNDDGTYNWFNFTTGGWRSLIAMGFILFLLLMFYLSWNETANQLQLCMSKIPIKIITDYSTGLRLTP